MTNLHTIIGRINEKLRINPTVYKGMPFPEKIGRYKFEKRLKFEASLSGYSFGQYRNGKRIAIAKAYFGNNKSHLFYGLQNEIKVYTLLAQKNSTPTKINKRYFAIPKVIDVARNENMLIALIQKVEATTKIGKGEQAQIYEDVITYIKKLKIPKSLKASINSISPYYMLFTSPFILFFALRHRPQLKTLILENYIYFIKNWKITGKYRWGTLVHRDLRASILSKKDRMFVVDWQLASISNDLLEFAQLFVTYFENRKMGMDFEKFERINKLTHEENKLFKLITIYVLLTEIGFVKTKKYIDEKILLKKLLTP